MAEDEPRHDESAFPAEPDKTGAELGETRESPGLAETHEHPPADVTAEGAEGATHGGPEIGRDGTSVIPPVPGAEPGPARWSARAQVRPSGVDEGAYPPVEWDETPEQPPRGAFVPVLVTACILLLLFLVALGVWLLLRSRDAGPVTPPTGVVTSSPGTPTTRPPAPATTAPARTTAPAPVAIPDLRGKDYDTAAAELVALGFVPSRMDEPDPEIPTGRVIGTDPPAGNVVLPGATITVRVSTGAPTVAPTETSSPANQ